MGKQIWDFKVIYANVNVEKEFRNYKFVVKREFETLEKYSIVKLTSMICEILRDKLIVDYEYIKTNFNRLMEISENTIHHYKVTDTLESLAEYVGGSMKLSADKYGFMSSYKRDADMLSIGTNQYLIDVCSLVAEKIHRPLSECFKMIFFAWLRFNCNLIELGKNAISLIEKECFG